MPDWLTSELMAQIARGVVVTVALTILTSVTSMLVGVVTAVGRHQGGRWFRRGSAAFVETFRNVPTLILLIFFAFAVPNLFPAGLRRTIFFQNVVMDGLGTLTTLAIPYYAVAAAIALTANTGAHLAELLRSGMSAVPQQRVDAARSLGASSRRASVTVLVPDGIRVAFPGIVNRLVHNLKNTALVGFVAVPDAFQEIQGAITKTFQASGLLILAAVLYLALATVLQFVLRRIEVGLWRGRRIDRTVDV